MKPQEILQRVSEKYSRCQSYSDCGVADFPNVDEVDERLLFRTYFSRSDRFRFEWQDYGPCRGKSETFSVLCSRDGSTCTLSPLGMEKNRNLADSISGATGCSAGAARYVPTLLMNVDVFREIPPWLELSQLIVTGTELLDDRDCYVVNGVWYNSEAFTLWIATTDFSLRRVKRDVYTSPEDKLLHPYQLPFVYSFSDVCFDQVISIERFRCPDSECKSH